MGDPIDDFGRGAKRLGAGLTTGCLSVGCLGILLLFVFGLLSSLWAGAGH